jgi:hypothetical protein
LLVPQRGDAVLQLVELRGELLVVALGKEMPELRTALAGAIELGVYFVNRSHDP